MGHRARCAWQVNAAFLGDHDFRLSCGVVDDDRHSAADRFIDHQWKVTSPPNGAESTPPPSTSGHRRSRAFSRTTTPFERAVAEFP